MSFATLALLVAVGLAGPLLAGLPRVTVPLVVGEILAGVVVGRSGLDRVPTGGRSDPGGQPHAVVPVVVGDPLRRPDGVEEGEGQDGEQDDAAGGHPAVEPPVG